MVAVAVGAAVGVEVDVDVTVMSICCPYIIYTYTSLGERQAVS